jgi:hypothetical protein
MGVITICMLGVTIVTIQQLKGVMPHWVAVDSVATVGEEMLAFAGKGLEIQTVRWSISTGGER